MKSIPRFQVITDETLQTRYSHVELARLAVEGGADSIQFREKRLKTTRELVNIAANMLEVCEKGDATLIVNDRVDVATAINNMAVHLGQDDLLVDVARQVIGADAIIGGTANSLEQAIEVEKTDVDYLGVGPVFGTTSKAKRAPDLGLESLAEICDQINKPVIAIGNIQPENVADVIGSGAWGIAVLSGIICQSNVTLATERYVEALDSAVQKK